MAIMIHVIGSLLIPKKYYMLYDDMSLIFQLSFVRKRLLFSEFALPTYPLVKLNMNASHIHFKHLSQMKGNIVNC